MTHILNSSKPKRWSMENGFVSYIMSVALQSVHKDNDGHAISAGWVQVLERDSAKPLEGMKSADVRACAKEMDGLVSSCFREATTVSTYRELALAAAILVVGLVKDGRVNDPTCQGVLIANALVLEHEEDNSWGSMKAARASADKMKDFLLRGSYFSCKTVLLH